MPEPVAAPLRFRPLTPERWPDLERLFGARGACAGCWCRWFRLARAEFERAQGAGNRAALHALVESGPPPGIVAYAGEEPVGWCALAPRSAYPLLARSRILKPVDDAPVWSIVCFFVARGWRRRGTTVELLRAATRYAREQGARVVEGYPVEPKAGATADTFAYHGLASAFRRAGFTEVARRSETRPIMRLVVA